MPMISTLPDALLSRLRCPRTLLPLVHRDGRLVSSDGQFSYSIVRGNVPDLRCAPSRLELSLPWVDPWVELGDLSFEYPGVLEAGDLPYHLDRYHAAVFGADGRDRWIMDLGCGPGECRDYFEDRGFRYVGVDVDVRGVGPNVLGDAHNLRFVDDSFDLCYCMACLEHVQSPLLATVEVARILKPGGVFSGSTAFLEGFHDKASFVHMSHADLHVLLSSAGFRDIRLWPGWHSTRSVPAALFGGRSRLGIPLAWVVAKVLRFGYRMHFEIANWLRFALGRPQRSLQTEDTLTAGAINFCCVRADTHVMRSDSTQ